MEISGQTILHFCFLDKNKTKSPFLAPAGNLAVAAGAAAAAAAEVLAAAFS